MKKIISKLLFFISFFFFIGVNAATLTAQHFKAIQDQALQLAHQVGPTHVLVALDMDNTLLTANHDFGSPQWYDWQTQLLKNDPHSPELVAPTQDALIRISTVVTQNIRMHPTESDIPASVKTLQQQGIKVIVITARNADMRPGTENQLERNAFDFQRTPLPVAFPTPSPYLPYQINQWKKFGLSSAEAKTLNLSSPRWVSYWKGIFMVAGQNKGVMLQTLLHRSPTVIRAIVFADDQQKNVNDMEQAFRSSSIRVVSIRYSYDDNAVKTFDYNRKTQVDHAWKRYVQQLSQP
ncbi:MAG TPA: DUF2608 domain-containing protein [Coxiellaceae bacterium]|nr:DUF2608 domain-containing protein [Coxiellaceae bacterium]